MVEFEVRENSHGPVIEKKSGAARQMAGWEWVSYKGRRYQLFGGIRGPYFIDLSNPIRSRKEKQEREARSKVHHATKKPKRSHAAKKAGLSADQRAEIDASLGAYGARLTDDDRIAKGDKVMSVQLEAKGGRLKMVGGGNVLATYPASRAGQGVSDFVEKFWFWKKATTASAHATRHYATKKSPAQLQREIDEALTRPSMPPSVAATLRRDLVKELLARGEEPSAQAAGQLSNAEIAELARGRGKSFNGEIVYSWSDLTEMADAIEEWP